MRVEGDFIVINKWLLPLSWLYGLAVKLRNFAFEAGILKSRSFDVPIISVGNITVGGTGKTPHVEYLAKHLKEISVRARDSSLPTPIPRCRKLATNPIR